MTEFEINKKVALKLGYIYTCNEGQVFVNDILFDPCNNPEQTWEIMLKYGIIIVYQSGEYEFTYNGKIEIDYEKPLVSAMLVFLDI